MTALIFTVVLALLIFVALLNLFILIFQEPLIFRGVNISKNTKYHFKENFEEIYLEGKNGAKIHTIHFKLKSPKGVILYFHGNRGDLRRWGHISSTLTKYGYDVFAMDYRGYGKSRGKRNEKNLYDDATLLRTYVNENFSYDKMVYFGRSLGSTLAVQLSTHTLPDLLILETPLSHINNALFKFRWFVNSRVISKYKFDSINKVDKINCPTIIFHGTRDYVVPIRFAKALQEKLASKNKIFIQINKGGHNNLNNFEFYHESLKKILAN